jgi:hypothetical protein
VGRINTRLFSLSQGAVMRRGNLTDLIQVCSVYSILRLKGGHLANLDAFPKALIRSKSSKKTSSIFILTPPHRRENRHGKKENALKVIWWTSVVQDWVFEPDILLWFSSSF